MSALVLLNEKNLSTEVATVKARSTGAGGIIAFKTADASAPDGTAPLVVPSSGTVRSVEVWLRLAIGAWGPYTQLSSPKFYTDGSSPFGAGVTLYVRTTNPSTYATPTTPANDTAGTNAYTYVSSAPKALDAVNTGPFSTLNSDFGDYLVLWLTVTSAAKAQRKDAEFRLPLDTFFFTWTET